MKHKKIGVLADATTIGTIAIMKHSVQIGTTSAGTVATTIQEGRVGA